MKKFELIRGIFNIVIREGFDDNKEDSISGYTKDKMENVVYVKKLDLKNYMGVDSVAITSLEYDFSDTCDSDLRVAFIDKNIGQRVIAYANELSYNILDGIYYYLTNIYSSSVEEKNYNILIKDYSINPQEPSEDGPMVKVHTKALQFVLACFKKAFIDNK